MSSIEVATGVKAVTSSHIEEVIKELTQPRGFEVPAIIAEEVPMSTATMTEEPSQPSSLSADLPSSTSQLGKRVGLL